MNTEIEIHPPISVAFLLEQLNRQGYEAWAVGGCIRDSLMGKTPDDWDFTTNALPEQTKQCFSEYPVVETGIRHGTVSIILKGTAYEITTYRIEQDYKDHRHPEQVCFTKDLEKDLARRDFTMNAIAWNPAMGIRDPFDGQRDIEKGLIRCVGIPTQRMEEDALRILRGIRFASVLGFSLESETRQAVLQTSPLLKLVAAERVRVEMEKLLLGNWVESALNEYVWILAQWIPELLSEECSQQWRWTASCIGNAPADRLLRLGLFFCGLWKHPASELSAASGILKRLRWDNRTCRQILVLIEHCEEQLEDGDYQLKQWLGKEGEETTQRILKLRQIRAPQDKRICKAWKQIADILEKDQCCSLKQLNITGSDLQAAELATGKKVGILLNKLLEGVMKNQFTNDRENLLIEAKRLAKILTNKE